MPKKLTSVIGVDIGSQAIKVAEVKLQGREPALTGLAMVPTPEGAVDHTGVYDVDNVAAALKEAYAAAGATSQHVVVSIAGQASVLVRTLEVPRMNPNELKEHMQWEINRNIPFAESTVVSDFKAFEPTDPGATNMDVVMAISPQTAIDTLIEIVKKSGKQPAAIDVEPLAIARALATGGGSTPGNTVCVVEIGNKTTSINMYRDGQLLMPRQLPIGGEMFTKAIQENLGVSMEEAEAIKTTRLRIPDSAGAAGGGSPYTSQTQSFTSYNPFADDPMLVSPHMAAGGPPPVTNAPVDNPFAEPTPYTAGAPLEPEPPAYNPFASVDEPVAPAPPMSTDPAYDVAGIEGLSGPPAPPMEAPPAAFAPAPLEDDPETIRYFNAVSIVLDEFLSEVRRSVDYFRSKGGEVSEVFLVGGGAHMRGLESFLGKTLALEVNTLDPLSGMAMSVKKAEPGLLEGRRQDFVVAAGNGLHICFE